MENIILQFLNIYFWVFISLLFIDIISRTIIKIFKPDWKLKKENNSFLSKIINLTLFILSIILT